MKLELVLVLKVHRILFLIAIAYSLNSQEIPELQGEDDLVSWSLLSRTGQGAPQITGILLVNGADPDLNGCKIQEIRTVCIKGLSPPGKESKLAQRLGDKFLKQPLDKAHLEGIKQEICDYYRENQQPMVKVVIPRQDASSGVIEVRVFEGRVGSVQIEGTHWTKDSLLKRQLGLKSGDPVDEKRILLALNAMNRNPFHTVNMIYAPGGKSSATDLTLAVEEKNPVRVYVAGENNGIRFAGRQRWLAGLNWGNAFWLNHIFTYQYISANQVKRFQAHTVQYVAPLSNNQILSVYGGYSYLHPKVNGIQSSHGYSGQASVRYTIPIKIYSGMSHEIIVGGDYKTTNTVVEYLDVAFAPTSQRVNLTQLMGGYQFQYLATNTKVTAKGELLWSPGSWLPDQSNSHYNSLRPGATHRWLYGRGLIDYTQTLPYQFNLNLHSLFQYATNNLIPSEQLGIGGYDTVRGYDERLLSKESGLILSLEIRTPAVSLFHQPKRPDYLLFLAFCDYGWGMNRTQIGTWERFDSILGIGPGLRYQWGDFFHIRADWGFRLLSLESPNTHIGNFLHFSLSLSK